jgi:hypothetical protein
LIVYLLFFTKNGKRYDKPDDMYDEYYFCEAQEVVRHGGIEAACSCLKKVKLRKNCPVTLREKNLQLNRLKLC